MQQIARTVDHGLESSETCTVNPGLPQSAMRRGGPRAPWLCLVLLTGAACGSSGGAGSGPIDAAPPTVDSGVPPDATCQGDTLQALCSAAGYVCGDATFTDRCGAPVMGSCGTCAIGTCGGDGVEHKCSVPGWAALEWPSFPQTRIFAMWSSPGSSTVWAGGGELGAGELWQIEDSQLSILDTASTITGVHAAGPDVWAVGLAGSVLHGNNDNFTLLPSADLRVYDLNAVWGFGPSDLWVTTANGVNSVAHWNGTRWTLGMLPSTAVIPGCTGLWASAPGDLWTVCLRGEIFHWDGTAWSKVSSPTTQDLQAIYGFAANDIWAVGNNNTLLHWNGATWRSVTAPSGGALIGIWGTAANDVYAVGNTGLQGRVLHFDGVSWTEVFATESAGELDRIAGAQGHIYAAGFPALLYTYP